MRYTLNQRSFFNYIHDIFGYNTVRLLKQWIYCNKEIIRTTFLPKHLNNYLTFNITFYNDNIKLQALSNTQRFIKNMLNLEITDNYKKRRTLISHLYNITRNIEKTYLHTYTKNFIKRRIVHYNY